jgi:hypothetical protein
VPRQPVNAPNGAWRGNDVKRQSKIACGSIWVPRRLFISLGQKRSCRCPRGSTVSEAQSGSAAQDQPVRRQPRADETVSVA